MNRTNRKRNQGNRNRISGRTSRGSIRTMLCHTASPHGFPEPPGSTTPSPPHSQTRYPRSAPPKVMSESPAHFGRNLNARESSTKRQKNIMVTHGNGLHLDKSRIILLLFSIFRRVASSSSNYFRTSEFLSLSIFIVVACLISSQARFDSIVDVVHHHRVFRLKFGEF